jgi:hypothetical protein
VIGQRIGALFTERRAVCTGVQVVAQTSFSSMRATTGTTATIPGRRTYANTPALHCAAGAGGRGRPEGRDPGGRRRRAGRAAVGRA